MRKRASYREFLDYLTRKDLYTPIFVRYFNLLSALYYPNNLKGEEILDLGCGKGEFIFLLGIKNKISLGVDNSQKQINLAKKTGNYKKIIKADICNLHKIIKKKYKFIICNSVLEHIKNLEKALKSVFLMLKPDGKFIFTVPQKGWENHLLHSKIEKNYGKEINTLLGHINLWNKTKWEEKLKKQQFKICTSREFISPYSCFLADILFIEKKVGNLGKSLYKLYLNDKKLCKIYGGGSLYFEVTK